MDRLNTLSSGQFGTATVNISCYDIHFPLFIVIGIFFLTGAPISAQTLRCPEFAVDNYSFTQGLLCLHRPRRVYNPGVLNYT
jgi:hypothetical protein